MKSILYTYPKGHPREGITTACLDTVWQCPKCHYTSNLTDDIKAHKQACYPERT